MHVRFEAEFHHPDVQNVNQPVSNPDEINLDDLSSSDEDEQATIEEETPGSTSPKTTLFLALDKCLPNRKFLEIIEIPTESSTGPLGVHLDPEWMAIVKATDHLISFGRYPKELPSEEEIRKKIKTELQWIKDQGPAFLHPPDFCQTAKPHDPRYPQESRQGNFF